MYYDAICKRGIKFLTKLQHSENTICRLFEKKIIDKLAIVHEHFASQVSEVIFAVSLFSTSTVHILLNRDDYYSI